MSEETNRPPEDDTMLAAVLYAPRDVRLERRPIPKINPDEVLVRVGAVGVCGSDVHFYIEGRIGQRVARKPLILGHESAGTVVAVGEQVKSLQVGDRVALEPGVPCRRCQYCKTGRYNLCPDVVFMAAAVFDGAFCEYYKTPADFAFKLPDSMTLEDGAMLEPLVVGLYSARRGRLAAGESVVILGSGPIGLMALQAARVFGATTRIVIDLQRDRLEMAKKLGATHVINARELNPVAAVESLLPDGADVVMEAAGATATIQMAINLVRRGGRIVWIGMPAQEHVLVHQWAYMYREVETIAVFRYHNCYPLAIDLASKGLVDIRSMVTHRFPLAKAAEALETAHAAAPGTIKVIVEP